MCGIPLFDFRTREAAPYNVSPPDQNVWSPWYTPFNIPDHIPPTVRYDDQLVPWPCGCGVLDDVDNQPSSEWLINSPDAREHLAKLFGKKKLMAPTSNELKGILGHSLESMRAKMKKMLETKLELPKDMANPIKPRKFRSDVKLEIKKLELNLHLMPMDVVPTSGGVPGPGKPLSSGGGMA